MDAIYEYIADLEEELENLSEQNRLLVERIKELEKELRYQTDIKRTGIADDTEISLF